jgi:hypothetical protein
MDPKIPKNEKDPTNLGALRARAFRDLNRRLKQANREVNLLISKIPYTTKRVAEIRNSFIVNEVIYEYQLNPQQAENLDAEIKMIIDKWMETAAANRPPRWFLSAYTDTGYSRGTTESFNNIKRIAPAATTATGQALTAVQIEQILLSAPYRTRLEKVRSRVFELMKGFSGDTALDLSRTLQEAVANGEGVNTIKRTIAGRFGVSSSRAERIARTEINKAFTDSKLDMTVQARDDLGIKVAVMHNSAIAPTSRRSHVDRTGNVYTPEQQRKWWSKGANRINCLCSTIEVLVDSKGQVVQKDVQKIIKDRKKDFKPN